MLPKKNRLAKDRDIKKVFARGRGFFNPFLNIKYLSAPGSARFALVVPTKVSKKAVRRNRLKRILREFLRRNLRSFEPGDYVLTLKPKTAVETENRLLAEFKQTAAKSGLYKNA